MKRCPLCQEPYPMITLPSPTGPYRRRAQSCRTEGCALEGRSPNTSTRAFNNAMKRYDDSRMFPTEGAET